MKTKIPTAEIARVVGYNVQTVRRHVREGLVDVRDLRSVVGYILDRVNEI